jgi:7-cyano-7-deazaguanine synthase in queuosine biosynthesis
MVKTHVLWTGGWDSTYRVLALLTDSENLVQPHYIINPSRRSNAIERRVMSEIANKANERVGKRILPLKMLRVEDIEITPEYRGYHNLLASRFKIGPQYLWLSEYVRQGGAERIEICIHLQDKAYAAISWAKQFSGSVDDHLYNAVQHLLLSKFSFPVINLSKKDMKKKAKERNLEDLLYLTWFCQEPTKAGRPCGFCGPCRWTIEDGLKHRIPVDRRFRAMLNLYIGKNLPSYRLRKFFLDAVSGGP